MGEGADVLKVKKLESWWILLGKDYRRRGVVQGNYDTQFKQAMNGTALPKQRECLASFNMSVTGKGLSKSSRPLEDAHAPEGSGRWPVGDWVTELCNESKFGPFTIINSDSVTLSIL